MLNISTSNAVSWPTPVATGVAPVTPVAAVQPAQASGGSDGQTQTGFGREGRAPQQPMRRLFVQLARPFGMDQRLAPARPFGPRPEQRLDPLRAKPADRQQQRRRIGDIHPPITQTGQQGAGKLLAARHQTVCQRLDLRPVEHRIIGPGVIGQTMGKALRGNDFIHIGDALVFRHRHRVDGMARGPAPQRQHVRQQVIAKACIISRRVRLV